MRLRNVARMMSIALIMATVITLAGSSSVQANGIGSLFVADEESGNVYVVDPISKTTVAVIDLAWRSHGMTFAPDAKTVYVANIAGHSMTVIDTVSEAVAETIPAGSGPVHTALSPNGRHVFLVDGDSAQLLQVDLESHMVTQTLSLGGDPHGIAISKNGRYVYVANQRLDMLQVVDTIAWKLAQSFPVSGGPSHVVLAPGQDHAYVSATAANAVVILNTMTGRIDNTVPLSEKPTTLAMTASGRYVFSVHQEEAVLSTIDTTSLAVTKIALPARGSGVAASPDNIHTYVAAGDANAVLVVDIPSLTVVDSIDVEGKPGELVMSPILAPTTHPTGPPLTIPAKLPRTGESTLAMYASPDAQEQIDQVLVPESMEWPLGALVLAVLSLVVYWCLRRQWKLG